MMKSNQMKKLLKYFFLGMIIIALLIFGYVRERYLLVFGSEKLFTFINKYPRLSATDFKKEINHLWALHLSPKLISSILYSIVFALLSTAFTYLITKEIFFIKLVFAGYGIYMAASLLLIIAGNFGVTYPLSYGLAHNIEDLFLSPFIIILILPIVFLKNKFYIKQKEDQN